uniref:DUF305 domain-containing protein n=1 Tax=Solibacter usitatus (strain Ellin6076) TaxID=234267 RepID=Q022J2_SOLUE
MAIRVSAISAVLLFLSAATALAQQPKAAAAPIVQPGAPGKRSKTLAPASVRTRSRAPVEADVSFMQGMIHHHSQAVEMVDLLRTRGQSKELQSLGERISISQTDEIRFMKQWLEDRGQPLVAGHGHMEHMAGMDHANMDHASMGAMPLMPGMLTPQQMETLANSKGLEFDHLFLTGMIQHHTGALIMVDDLFDVPGAGQDPVLFDFASDIDNTQRAEINIMRGMLKEKQ